MRITRATIQKLVKEEGGNPFPLVHIMNGEGQFVKTLRSGYEVSFAIEMPFSERRARRVIRQVLTKGNFRLAKVTRGDPNPTIDPDSLGHFLHVSFTVEDKPRSRRAGRLNS